MKPIHSAGNVFFKSQMKAILPAFKEIMKKNEPNSLKGLQSLAVLMGGNNSLTNGSGVLAQIILDTMKSYDAKKPMPVIRLRKILDAFKGKFSEHRMLEMIKGMEFYGLLKITYEDNLNPLYQMHPDYTKIQLDDIWKRYLTRYKATSKEEVLYTESISRLIWASILAIGDEASGVRTFKVLSIILDNVNSNRELSIDECERYCSQIGVGTFAQLRSKNFQMTEEIRFFDEVGDVKIKLNKNVVAIWNKYIIPISQEIMRKQGISI